MNKQQYMRWAGEVAKQEYSMKEQRTFFACITEGKETSVLVGEGR